jgi:osmotically-inducible protein OsmY
MHSPALFFPKEFTQDARRNAERSPRISGGTDKLTSAKDRRLYDLKARVATALVHSGYAALAFIGCDVDQNRVILSGSVPTYHLKQLAQVYAQRVDGVGRVDNRLAVQQRRPA